MSDRASQLRKHPIKSGPDYTYLQREIDLTKRWRQLRYFSHKRITSVTTVAAGVTCLTAFGRGLFHTKQGYKSFYLHTKGGGPWTLHGEEEKDAKWLRRVLRHSWSIYWDPKKPPSPRAGRYRRYRYLRYFWIPVSKSSAGGVSISCSLSCLAQMMCTKEGKWISFLC